MRRRHTDIGSVVTIDRVYTPELDPTPEEAGREFADLATGEPLGSIVDSLVYDRDGLAWWGKPPLPPIRPTR